MDSFLSLLLGRRSRTEVWSRHFQMCVVLCSFPSQRYLSLCIALLCLGRPKCHPRRSALQASCGLRDDTAAVLPSTC